MTEVLVGLLVIAMSLFLSWVVGNVLAVIRPPSYRGTGSERHMLDTVSGFTVLALVAVVGVFCWIIGAALLGSF